MRIVFTNGPGDQGSIPGRVIAKTQKRYLMLPSLKLSVAFKVISLYQKLSMRKLKKRKKGTSGGTVAILVLAASYLNKSIKISHPQHCLLSSTGDEMNRTIQLPHKCLSRGLLFGCFRSKLT